MINRKGVSSINFRNNFGGKINSIENLNTNDAYFASIMKNPAGIKLKDEIIESGVDLNDIPILVIDDESDSASPNVASRKKIRIVYLEQMKKLETYSKNFLVHSTLLILLLLMQMYLLVLIMKMIFSQKILLPLLLLHQVYGIKRFSRSKIY